MREIAARLGREEMTLYKRRKRWHDQIYGWIEELVERELEAVIAKRVRKIEEKADIKARINKKAYDKLEKLVDRQELDVLALNSVSEGLDRTEGKAVDRRAVHSLNETVKRVEVSVDDLSELFSEIRALTGPRDTQPLLPEATEAEIVGSPEN